MCRKRISSCPRILHFGLVQDFLSRIQYGTTRSSAGAIRLGRSSCTVFQSDIEVDAEIGVDKPVSHCDNTGPGDGSQLLPSRVGYLGRGFANDLDILDQRQERYWRSGLQVLPHPCRRAKDTASRAADAEHPGSRRISVMPAHTDTSALSRTSLFGSMDSDPRHSAQGRLSAFRRRVQ